MMSSSRSQDVMQSSSSQKQSGTPPLSTTSSTSKSMATMSNESPNVSMMPCGKHSGCNGNSPTGEHTESPHPLETGDRKPGPLPAAPTREPFIPPLYTHLLEEFTELQKPLSLFEELPKDVVHLNGDTEEEIDTALPGKHAHAWPAGCIDDVERALTITEMEKAAAHIPAIGPVRHLPGTSAVTVALCLRDALRYFARHMEEPAVRAIVGDVATKQTRHRTLPNCSDMNPKAKRFIDSIVNDCNGLIQGAMLLATGKVTRPGPHPETEGKATATPPNDYLQLTPLITGIVATALTCSTDFADFHAIHDVPVVICNTDTTPAAVALVRLTHSHRHHNTFFKRSVTLTTSYECSVLVFTESHQETFRKALQWVLHQIRGYELICGTE